ncbi:MULTISPECIES: helix-turn-helix domain-containing protein [unclassified Sporosarcina]|uniref:helix-turn-helix domain-containing protein n=1 Tax=unclassified Sporosarcina TaxID=2647733 RepID=UPI00203B37F1|nr:MULTISPECIES: helix-turn-helix domain-containing protein [unclassified Sporosarcina]GKV64166.1 swarming motility protein SwrB [Sporosarcina sp. NCCP-2331]GLB54369.1 swarming motility protein SwrB [Sporosarcina sp. NCCP-2378]
MGIIVAILFILQIISFMIMTLLFLKVSKFNNLEKKQQQLMDEMDHSVMAYLAEIKEENDRLIEQLNRKTDFTLSPEVPFQQPPVKQKPAAEPERVQQKSHPVPVQFALRSYQKTAATTEQQEAEPLDDRAKAKLMHAEGKSVEEIAKELGKGRTEIELLLKFS